MTSFISRRFLLCTGGLYAGTLPFWMRHGHTASNQIISGQIISGKTPPAARPTPDIDPYTRQRITDLTALMPQKRGTEERFSALSEAFLGTPYQADHLRGSATQPEKFIIDFRGVDCLTFLEYVTALNKSICLEDFIENLIHTRYHNNNVSFTSRRHFFSDWLSDMPRLARDITGLLGGADAVTITKRLNQKDNKGGKWLPGLAVTPRPITCIAPENITQAMLGQLKSGDLIGFYTPKEGLDVTHTGFAIRTGRGLLFRNASSLPQNRKVVDIALVDYMAHRPGLLIYRPL